MQIDANLVILATAVAGVVAPWLVEIIKKFIGNPQDKKAVVLTMVVSLVLGAGVEWYAKGSSFVWEPLTVLIAAAEVMGIATVIYKLFQSAVEQPVKKLIQGLSA